MKISKILEKLKDSFPFTESDSDNLDFDDNNFDVHNCDIDPKSLDELIYTYNHAEEIVSRNEKNYGEKESIHKNIIRHQYKEENIQGKTIKISPIIRKTYDEREQI